MVTSSRQDTRGEACPPGVLGSTAFSQRASRAGGLVALTGVPISAGRACG